MKGRELFKIVKLFKREQETWATIQKTEDQFRAKEYDVKAEELLPIEESNNYDTNDEITEAEIINDHADNKDTGLSHTSSNVMDAYNVDQSHRHQQVAPAKRPARESANQAKCRNKELADHKVLAIETTKITPPKHAWEWQSFVDMIDMEDLCTIRRTKKNPTSITTLPETTSEEDLQWDNSPEQFILYQPNNPPQIPTGHIENANLPTDLDDESPLTELDTDSDDVFNNPEPLTRSHRLKRSAAFRRRRRRTNPNLYEPQSTDEIPTTDNEPPRNYRSRPLVPLYPNDVQLGPAVQNMSNPLIMIQPNLPTTPPRRPTRTTRSNLDYKRFHRDGDRHPRL